MTQTSPAAPMHEIKSAAMVLSEDVICQSFVQGSSTLAYASLLIRRKRYELAGHVLHSLEAKQASRFKDMVFYLQAQIGIETGEFAIMKKRLVPRVHQHPNDLVALSLLECCVYQEYEEWESLHPPVARAAATHHDTPKSVFPADLSRGPGSLAETRAPVDSEPAALRSAAAVSSRTVSSRTDPSRTDTPVSVTAPAASRPPAGMPVEKDFGIYQSLVNDVNTQALVLWNPAQGRFKASCRNSEMEESVSRLPEALPGSIAVACEALDGGPVHKICFSFQTLTITTFHAGAENMGLVTGNIGQSLLSMVRAENVFLKIAASAHPSVARREAAGDE